MVGFHDGALEKVEMRGLSSGHSFKHDAEKASDAWLLRTEEKPREVETCLDDIDRDVDVAANGFGVGAGLMRRVGECSSDGVFHARQADV